jgi:hypothetical protein
MGLRFQAMRWFGPAKEIEIVDEGNALVVRATPVRRVIDFLGPAIFGAVMIRYAWRGASWIFILVVIFSIAVLFTSVLRPGNGELRMTESALTASGDQGRWTSGYVELQWGEIRSLKYQNLEDGLSGLFAKTGRFRSQCLMAGLNRSQTEEILAALERRFPSVLPPSIL